MDNQEKRSVQNFENMHLKKEPGTSDTPVLQSYLSLKPSKDSNNLTLLGLNLKQEPGTSQPPVLQRLPSLKPPRDLTLSAYKNIMNPSAVAKKNKIYVPNFNVTRNKSSE